MRLLLRPLLRLLLLLLLIGVKIPLVLALLLLSWMTLLKLLLLHAMLLLPWHTHVLLWISMLLLLLWLLWLLLLLLLLMTILLLLLLLLLLPHPSLLIKIGIAVSTLIRILMSHVHGRGRHGIAHGIPVTLHKSGVSNATWRLLHHSVHAPPVMLLLAGVAAVRIGSAHLGVLLLGIGVAVSPAIAGHLRLGSRHLTLVGRRRLCGSCALAVGWHLLFSNINRL